MKQFLASWGLACTYACMIKSPIKKKFANLQNVFLRLLSRQMSLQFVELLLPRFVPLSSILARTLAQFVVGSKHQQQFCQSQPLESLLAFLQKTFPELLPTTVCHWKMIRFCGSPRRNTSMLGEKKQLLETISGHLFAFYSLCVAMICWRLRVTFNNCSPLMHMQCSSQSIQPWTICNSRLNCTRNKISNFQFCENYLHLLTNFGVLVDFICKDNFAERDLIGQVTNCLLPLLHCIGFQQNCIGFNGFHIADVLKEDKFVFYWWAPDWKFTQDNSR